MQTAATPSIQTVPSSKVNRPVQNNTLRRNEQSFDYVLRSGLAGGMAGCLVKKKVHERINEEKTDGLIG
jgi:hypothetical protein